MAPAALVLFGFLVMGSASIAAAEVAADMPPAQSEAVPQGAPPTAPRTGRQRFVDPDDGQLDVSDFLAHPRAFLPIPVIVTEPAVGYGGGAVGLFLRPRKEAGDEGWARPNMSAVGALATQNGTRGAFAGDASRWIGGRLKTLAGAGTGRINLDFYGLGNESASADQKVRYSLNFTGAVAQGNWQLAPKSPWALGLRYVFADVEPTLRDEPAFPGLADRTRFRISAPSVIIEFDTRDNVFTPTRGVFAETSWMASRQVLGASVDFDQLRQVLFAWHPIARDLTAGARGDYAWTSSGTPFFLRPFVMLRGVPAMRYQGDRMGSVEAEVRWQFFGRWSLVGFGGAGTVRTERDAFSAAQNVASGGVGFRYELARRFGLHAGMDVARSTGTTAVYLQIGSAWLRP
jgi:hypothetical protein